MSRGHELPANLIASKVDRLRRRCTEDDSPKASEEARGAFLDPQESGSGRCRRGSCPVGVACGRSLLTSCCSGLSSCRAKAWLQGSSDLQTRFDGVGGKGHQTGHQARYHTCMNSHGTR